MTKSILIALILTFCGCSGADDPADPTIPDPIHDTATETGIGTTPGNITGMGGQSSVTQVLSGIGGQTKGLVADTGGSSNIPSSTSHVATTGGSSSIPATTTQISGTGGATTVPATTTHISMGTETINQIATGTGVAINTGTASAITTSTGTGTTIDLCAAHDGSVAGCPCDTILIAYCHSWGTACYQGLCK